MYVMNVFTVRIYVYDVIIAGISFTLALCMYVCMNCMYVLCVVRMYTYIYIHHIQLFALLALRIEYQGFQNSECEGVDKKGSCIEAKRSLRDEQGVQGQPGRRNADRKP